MPSSPQGKLGRTLRRFRRSRRGSAAVEFSLVALPFFAMLFAIVEFSLMFLAGQVLETATQDTARLLFTNQAQAQNFDALKFKKQLCDRLGGVLFNCQEDTLDGGVLVDVKVIPKFSSVSSADLADPIENGQIKGSFGYSNPPPGSTVIVRAFYQWPLFVNIDGYSLANLVGDGQRGRLLTAMAAFRVEPGG
jgi:Flp pilus assembly protein TadG